MHFYAVKSWVNRVANYTVLWCKIFGLKFRWCKNMDRYLVWWQRRCHTWRCADVAAAQAARPEEQTARRRLLISPPRGCRVDTWRPIGSHLHDSISRETTNKLLSHLLPLGIFIQWPVFFQIWSKNCQQTHDWFNGKSDSHGHQSRSKSQWWW